MIVPIFLCTFLGIFLDRVFHTSFIVVVLFFLGAFAGFRNIYLFAQGNNSKKSYLGSDADKKIEDISRNGKESEPEDITQIIDRVYRENKGE